MLKKNDEDYSGVETVDTGPTYFLEEDVYVDEKYVKNKSLIRMDMNIVQFPIFSKNAKRKKNEITTYYFNKNKDTYITIKPSAGELIPGEGEERIFIALMKLMKEKGMEQEFFVTAKEIKDAVKINSSNYISEIKKSLLRLSESSYNFKNTMYSNEVGAILKEEVSTPILTFKAKQLDLTENKNLKININDGRIREVYLIRISDHFYKNIVKRGYLVYDSNILLDINSGVARTLYMLLEKIRFDSLYVKESIFALIKKIPLKYEKKSLPVTIKTLEKAFNELLDKKLIKEFHFIKPTTWLEADVEVFFNESHNTIKQERFTEDNKELKNLYGTLAISFTEKKNIEEANSVEKMIVTKEIINTVLALLPKKALSLKTMPETIKDSIEIYGYERVMEVAKYVKKNKIDKIRAYFLKALKENWIIDSQETIKNNPEVTTLTTEEIRDNLLRNTNNEEALNYFNSLGESEKQEIEDKVYSEYIKECGQETKVQKIAFSGAKNGLISKFLVKEKMKEIEKNIEIPQANGYVKIIDDISEFNRYINESVNVYKVILNLTEDRIFEIKREILKNLTSKFVMKTLTLEEVNQEIADKMK